MLAPGRVGMAEGPGTGRSAPLMATRKPASRVEPWTGVYRHGPGAGTQWPVTPASPHPCTAFWVPTLYVLQKLNAKMRPACVQLPLSQFWGLGVMT